MDVTTEMLQAAMRKAAEAGLLPRHARNEEMLINQDLIRIVLQAALDAAPGRRPSHGMQPTHRRYLSDIASLPSAVPGYYRNFAK